jgi:hypothetical protein
MARDLTARGTWGQQPMRKAALRRAPRSTTSTCVANSATVLGIRT